MKAFGINLKRTVLCIKEKIYKLTLIQKSITM